jgi:hypothetical protein
MAQDPGDIVIRSLVGLRQRGIGSGVMRQSHGGSASVVWLMLAQRGAHSFISRSSERYWIASATCGVVMSGTPSRSAMVRAILSTRW